MTFLNKLLTLLGTKMETPPLYGAFHLISLALTAAAAVLLCATHRGRGPKRAERVAFLTAVVVFALEIYKQVVYTFTPGDPITASYQWYAFPWQFCSTPMYVGLLLGLVPKGRVKDSLLAYLATYALFGGLCVMLYPATVFYDLVGINLQTMICHGSMLAVGAYLLFSGAVKLEHKTLLRALPVFASVVGIAMLLNELALRVGIMPEHTFNMFFISPHAEPALVLYADLQRALPFPLCILIYFSAFSLAAYLVLLASMGIRRLTRRR